MPEYISEAELKNKAAQLEGSGLGSLFLGFASLGGAALLLRSFDPSLIKSNYNEMRYWFPYASDTEITQNLATTGIVFELAAIGFAVAGILLLSLGTARINTGLALDRKVIAVS